MDAKTKPMEVATFDEVSRSGLVLEYYISVTSILHQGVGDNALIA